MYRSFLRESNSVAIGLLLFVLAVGVFLPSIHNDFINYDDDIYLYENTHVQNGFSSQTIGWAFTNLDAGFWQPLTWLSVLLDCQLFGLRAAGHHLTSLLLHAANTVLLFPLLFRRMTGATWRSAFVAALFAVHPLHVEPVAWVSDRKDILCAFFSMLALLTYLCYAKNRSEAVAPNPALGPRLLPFDHLLRLDYLLALLFFLCALMSKGTF